MNLSPKDRFVEMNQAENWAAIMSSSWFQDGLTASLAQLVMNSAATGNDPAAAAAAFNRMEGAKALIVVMLNLAQTSPVKKSPIAQNLKPV